MIKLKLLRKWKVEVFLSRESVEHLDGARLKELANMIDDIEDSFKRSGDSFYQQKDGEFVRNLGNNR